MRKSPLAEGVFKPKPTAIETRHDATNRAARQIIGSEASAREAKTERLKAARLARDAKRAKSVPASRIVAQRKRVSSKGAVPLQNEEAGHA